MKAISVLASIVLLLSLNSSCNLLVNSIDKTTTLHFETSTIKSNLEILTNSSKYDYNRCRNQSESKNNDGEISHCLMNRPLLLKESKVKERLSKTEKLSQNTSTTTAVPRCGVRDGPLFYSAENRWTKKSFTWKLIQGYLPSFGADRTRAQLRESFNDWARYVPLTFTEVSQYDKADFELAFVHRYHDVIGRFDGPGGTLAYAYLPPSGVIRFEAEEPWTDKYTQTGFNLRLVATHEIGHALGLGHSNDPSSIMFERYQLLQPKQILPKDDINGIQSLYGRRYSPRRTHRTSTRRTTPWRMTTYRPIVTRTTVMPRYRPPTTSRMTRYRLTTPRPRTRRNRPPPWRTRQYRPPSQPPPWRTTGFRSTTQRTTRYTPTRAWWMTRRTLTTSTSRTRRYQSTTTSRTTKYRPTAAWTTTKKKTIPTRIIKKTTARKISSTWATPRKTRAVKKITKSTWATRQTAAQTKRRRFTTTWPTRTVILTFWTARMIPPIRQSSRRITKTIEPVRRIQASTKTFEDTRKLTTTTAATKKMLTTRLSATSKVTERMRQLTTAKPVEIERKRTTTLGEVVRKTTVIGITTKQTTTGPTRRSTAAPTTTRKTLSTTEPSTKTTSTTKSTLTTKKPTARQITVRTNTTTKPTTTGVVTRVSVRTPATNSTTRKIDEKTTNVSMRSTTIGTTIKVTRIMGSMPIGTTTATSKLASTTGALTKMTTTVNARKVASTTTTATTIAVLPISKTTRLTVITASSGKGKLKLQ